MQEEHVRQRQDDDFHLSHSLKNERWKHFNSCCLNLNITLPKQVSNVVTTIVEKQSIRQAVTVFICNLLSIKGEFTLAYSRRHFTLPKVYNKRSISYVKIIQAADWLVQNGYALEQRGNASSNPELRFSSYLWPTPKLLELFGKPVKDQLNIDYVKTQVCVILRDADKKEVEYVQTKEVKAMSVDMEMINLNNHKFNFTDPYGRDLNCSNLTRIFSEDFRFGGRLYRTDAHRIKQDNNDKMQTRLGIRIDGMVVVEIDFCNLHAMMLCAIENINTVDYHGDIYDFVLRKCYLDYAEQDRKLVKQAMNIMLNTETGEKAIQAIQGLINAQPMNQLRWTFVSGKVVWQMIYDCMPPFQKYFDNPDKIGMRLQRMDSDIAVRVCNYFVSRNRPVIPVHDSFIVWDIDGDDLLRAMTDAFKHVTKCPSNFPVFFRVESAYFPTEKVVMY